MKTRTIFILVTFILLFGINKISLHRDIKRQNENLTDVNVSGKQRMYSQKITKLSLFYTENFNDLSNNNESLQETLTNFSKAHISLKEGIAKFDDDNLTSLFKDLEPYYNKIVENTNALINKDKNYAETINYVNNIKIAANNFLPIMDNIVGLYERIGKDRGEIILKREFTFNLILLGLSIYTVVFLILPVINAYYETNKLSFF